MAQVAVFLLPSFVTAERWTAPPAAGRPWLAVMGGPGQTAFSRTTPRVLRRLGYRLRVIESVPTADAMARRLVPVVLIERQHFTKEQYERLRAYVRQGGGLVLVGYAGNWLDANGNQKRDGGDPEIRGERGSGGLVDVVGAARVGGTFLLKELRPVSQDPVSEGVEAMSWDEPTMKERCNCVTLRAATGTVACRMVRRKHDWKSGPGDVDAGIHTLVVRRSCGRGRAVWIGWTGIVGATRKGNATAERLLRNAIGWVAQGADLARRPEDEDEAESQLWAPKPGRFVSSFDPALRPRRNNVQTMMCHFTGRWHKVFGPPAKFAQWLADHHVEIVRVNVAARHLAIYPSKVPGVQEWPVSKEYRDRTGRDLLGNLLTEVHRRGIKLRGDYNHFDRGKLPLPRAVAKDGQPSDRRYCWLSPEFAHLTRQLMAELFSRYALDGLVIEDDRLSQCFCQRCLEGFECYCQQRGVEYVDPRQIDSKTQRPLWRLFGRYRAQRYYEQVVGPMRQIVHERRPGAKLGAWVGRWMRESSTGYSRIGLAPFVDFEWHMAYVDPPGVADDVWSDLACLSRFESEEGAAIRPNGTAGYTVRCLTAALESGSCVVGVYPEFIKTHQDPGYEGMAQVFARAEAMWTDRYERQLASLGDVVVLGGEQVLFPRERRVLFARAGLDVREVQLYDDGRRVSGLKPFIAGAGAVVAAEDVMLTDDDLAELERFVRAGGGLYVEPPALSTRPELVAGDIVASPTARTDVAAWLKRLDVTLGDTMPVAWMALRADHAAVSGMAKSATMFGLCRRVSPGGALLCTIGRDAATRSPMLCAGAVGRGRVICFGGNSSHVWSAALLPRLCRWLVRAEDIRLSNRRVSGHTAVAVFANTGKHRFEGPLGIALPAEAKVRQVTVNGRRASVLHETRWGSTRRVYVTVAVEPGETSEARLTADRLLASN